MTQKFPILLEPKSVFRFVSKKNGKLHVWSSKKRILSLSLSSESVVIRAFYNFFSPFVNPFDDFSGVAYGDAV